MTVEARKVAILTGAGSGIGKAAAVALAKDGWTLVLAGRRSESLQSVATALSAHTSVLVQPTDVTEPESVRALFDAAVAQFGRVDLLFNNAGIGVPAVPFEELSIAHWRAVVDTNLSGMFYCMQNAFRVMKLQTPQGGRIINNGSISAHAPRPNSAAYTATKHAVMGLTKVGALDGRAFDIAVGQIDVGNAGTELAQQLTQGVRQANGDICNEPLMDVALVGESVRYMASLPLSANVLFHTVMATKMPFVGRG